MKRIATTVLAAFFLLFSTASAQVPVSKVVDTSWLENTAVKYGWLSSIAAHGALTGIVESAKYGGERISTSGDVYHVFRYGQDVAGIASGWFGLSVWQNKHYTGWEKAGLYAEGIIWRSLLYDLDYRWNRTGNPFDYNPEHSFNKKTIVYVEFYGWVPRDAYIGIGWVTGPVYDILRVAVGSYLHAKID